MDACGLMIVAGLALVPPAFATTAACSVPELRGTSYRVQGKALVLRDETGAKLRLEGLTIAQRAVGTSAYDVVWASWVPVSPGGERIESFGPVEAAPGRRTKIGSAIEWPKVPYASHAMLRTTLNPRCGRMVGTVRYGKQVRRLKAVRARCGDRVVDRFAGEDCEKTADCAAGSCVADCTCGGAGGRPDPTFGVDGLVRTVMGEGFLVCPGGACGPSGVGQIVLQPDGKILALGHAIVGTLNAPHSVTPTIVRFTASGIRDPTFSEDGAVSVVAERMTLGANGAIALVGELEGLRSGPLPGRLLPDGAPDPLFMGQLGSTYRAGVVATTVVSSGDILAIVYDGAVDRWASTGGYLGTVSLPGDVKAVAFDSAGRILAQQTGTDVRLRRFLVDGSVDTSFGGGLHVCVALGASRDYIGRSLAILPSGEIFVMTTQGAGLVVHRIPPDGRGFDPTCASVPPPFDIGGTGLMPFAMQADGKLLGAVAGRVVRYLPDGGLDPDFGRLGTVDFGSSMPAVTDVAVASDGGIVVGGAGFDEKGHNAFVVARLLP
jgi:uncharacterized delta-60 repeat protein